MYNQFNSQQQSTWISIKIESLRSKPDPLQLPRNNQASHGGATITLSSCRCQWPNFCKAELARSGTPQGLYHCSCLSACIYNCTVFLLMISSISLRSGTTRALSVFLPPCVSNGSSLLLQCLEADLLVNKLWQKQKQSTSYLFPRHRKLDFMRTGGRAGLEWGSHRVVSHDFIIQRIWWSVQ